MKIYIDFDDVICETALFFTKIAKELFGIDVPYSEVQFFNLKKSFDITDEQYDKLMRVGHYPENLLSYEETIGASKIINQWASEGHEVSVVTGRPYDSYEPSRRWLDEHGLARIPLFCVDKYGRETFNQNCTYSMTLEQLYQMNFDFAIEDSPAAFEHVMHFEKCRIAVFSRPWNKNVLLPNDSFIRCTDWNEIDCVFQKYVREALEADGHLL
ncbi:MAG: 2-dehydropantoate 2-reductase [Lachnospiraceae bacterium]|nr:2-dehydropantoate 2-reductase [Lachnospiraceae bacterium]